MDAGCPARARRGALGEALAAAYLELRGYSLLGRNLRVGHKEIDLLARRGDCLVFVEVKLRASDRFGSAAEGLGPDKRRRLREALRAECIRRGWRGEVRLDLVALDLAPGQDRLVLEHYRGL